MDKTPLLKSHGYKAIIEGLTRTDTQQVAELLKPFLHDLADAGLEKVAILTYMIGIKQGRHETVERAKDKLMEFHKAGMRSALHQLAMLVCMHPGTPATTHIDNLLAACNGSQGKDSPVNE